MSQELEATADYIVTLPLSEIAAFVDEPNRSAARMVAELRAERDQEIEAWNALSSDERARLRLERRTEPTRRLRTRSQ